MSTNNNERFLAFSKPFVDAIRNVFTTMVFTEISSLKPELKSVGAKAKGDISVVMGLNGNVKSGEAMIPFKGMMVLSFSTSTYINFANAMISTEYKEMHEDIKDVGAEISNITTGNAKKVLRNMGYLIDMSIPSTIVGPNHEVQYPGNTQVILIPFESAKGSFVMELCYQDVEKKI